MSATAGPGPVRSTPEGVELEVRVRPRASRTELVGVREGVVEIRVAAPPVDDAANEELVRFLAKALGVGRRAVRVVSGERSRHKRVRLEGVDEAAVQAWLGAG